jgi:hypothetical protein
MEFKLEKYSYDTDKNLDADEGPAKSAFKTCGCGIHPACDEKLS